MNSHCAPLHVSSGGRLQSVWPVSLWGAEECWLFYDSAVDLWTVGAAGKEARCKSQNFIGLVHAGMETWNLMTSFFFKEAMFEYVVKHAQAKTAVVGAGCMARLSESRHWSDHTPTPAWIDPETRSVRVMGWLMILLYLAIKHWIPLSFGQNCLDPHYFPILNPHQSISRTLQHIPTGHVPAAWGRVNSSAHLCSTAPLPCRSGRHSNHERSGRKIHDRRMESIKSRVACWFRVSANFCFSSFIYLNLYIYIGLKG